MGYAIARIAELQLRLALKGWFLRGGISVGDYYQDPRVIFGPAFLQAYLLEGKQAREPRVVLSEAALGFQKRFLEYYAEKHEAPQNGYCLVDVDGVGFVNYLYAPIGLADDFEEAARSAGIHKVRVEEALESHRSDPVIWAKFRWVGVYHNFFCGTWLPKEPDLLIPNQTLGSSPSLLVARPLRPA